MLASLFSPFPWLLLSFLFLLLLKSQFIPLNWLAITPDSLWNPLHWHTIFTAGLSHKTFLHFGINFSFLGILTWIYLSQNTKKSFYCLTKIALISNLLHGLLLSILIHSSTYTSYIYGSSGIVCALASFLSYSYSSINSRRISILKVIVIGLVLFSLMDIFYRTTHVFSSWSHLLGVILGLCLTRLWKCEE